MGLYNGKTTAAVSLYCSEPDSLDGEISDVGTVSDLEGVSQNVIHSCRSVY